MNSKREITAEEIVKELTKEAPQGGQVSYEDVTIKGRLDLRHRIIQVAVTLTNCIFTDEVDLSYCEFMQCVDFSRSHFGKNFNSRWAIYRKALLFEEAIFEGRTVFAEVDCEGIGYFGGALFKSSCEEVNFISAKFSELLCQGEFLFRIDLNSLSGSGSNNVRDSVIQEFAGRQIVLSQIKEEGEIWVITDANNVTYTMVRHADALSIYRYRRTIFKGGADFNNLQCKGNGLFNNILFDNPDKEINFIGARFDILSGSG